MPASEARRIGVILHDFPAGGTERIVVRLANAWAASGRAVTFYCGTRAGPAYADLADGIAVVSATPAIPRGFLSRVRLGRWLRCAIERDAPDVLVVPGNFHLPVIMAAGRLPCAVAMKISNPLHRARRRSLLAGIVRRVARTRVDCFVAMSPALAREAQALLGQACATLAEPILTRALPIRTRPSDPPLVVCAGRMVAQKNFALAIQAFAELRHSLARLVMLGDGPERGALEQLAIDLGVADRVRFAGHVPDIGPWLADAHAFLLTSRYEGYPAVLVEAIAAGVPVVTTASSPAVAEIVTPGSGIVAEAEPSALAEALVRVRAAGGVAETDRQTLVRRHDAETAAAAWLAMLDDLVASR